MQLNEIFSPDEEEPNFKILDLPVSDEGKRLLPLRGHRSRDIFATILFYEHQQANETFEWLFRAAVNTNLFKGKELKLDEDGKNYIPFGEKGSARYVDTALRRAYGDDEEKVQQAKLFLVADAIDNNRFQPVDGAEPTIGIAPLNELSVSDEVMELEMAELVDSTLHSGLSIEGFENN